MKLAGRVIVVTGGAGGIGGGIAAALAAEGALTVVADRDEFGARKVAAVIQQQGGQAEAVAVDVSDRVQVFDLVAQVVRRHGRLDQMWNNAGLVQVGPLLEITAEEWQRVFAVNVEGVLFGTQAALQQMLRQPIDLAFGCRGKIVNTSSGAADKGRPMLAAYGASKAAVNHITKSTVAAFADQAICATVLYPGNVFEGMWREIDRRWNTIEGLPPGESARRRAADSPRGRFQLPEEVGEIARYIALAPGLSLNGKIVVADAAVMDL